MKVQLANGISYGTKWEDRNIFDIPGAVTLKQAAYLAVRKSHEFLTDKNHKRKVTINESAMWGGEKIYFNSVTIYPNENTPRYQNPYGVDYWFSVEFRPV